MSAVAEIVMQVDALTAATLQAWRELAGAAGLPYATPEWMLGFWHGLHEPGAQLQVVIVRDAGVVIGVAPFYGPLARGRLGLAELHLLGAGIGQRTAPLADRGREDDVARAIAGALRGAEPSPSLLRFDGVDGASPWPDRLADGWPGRARPRVRIDRRAPAPVVTMAADHATWRAGRSRNFRSQLGRSARAVAERGGVLRRSETRAEVEADLDALFGLHELRFAAQGRETALGSYRAAVGGAVHALRERDAARLWVIDADGGVVAAQLHVHAGDRVCFWNGGFDPAWEHERPGLVLLETAVRDAHELGARVLDLGAGATPYKLRFADADEPLAWTTLYVRDARYPLARAREVPAQAREAARGLARRLPANLQERLRRSGSH